ncbi:MAG: hypothetical protein RBU29_08835, partial [bacterium]|nr:hypothetical protein [bacterium]
MSQTAAAFFFQLQGTSKAGLLSKPSPAPGASPTSPVFQLVLADSVRSQAGSLVPPQSVRAIPASLEKLQQQSNETIHVYPLPKGSVKIDAEGNILLSPSVWKAIQTGTEIPTTLGTDPTSQTDEAAMIRIPIENKGDIQAFYQFLETGIESDAGEGQSEFLSITQPPLQVAAPQSLQQIASEAPEKPEIPAAANSLPPVQKPQTEENRPVDIKTAGAEKIVPTPQRNPALPPVLTHFLQQAAANQELPALTAAIHQIAQSTHSEDFMDALHEFGKSHGLDISTILNNASRLASSRQDNLAAPSAQTVQPNPSKPSPENSAGEPKPSIQDNRSHTQASPSVPIRVETKQASQPETQAYTAERFAKPGKTSNASTGFQKDHTNFTRTTIQETLTEENTGNNSPVAPTESEHSFNRGENKPSQEQPIPSVVFSAPRSVNPASATATAPAPIRMETKQASQPEILANPATRSVELGKTAVAPARFHEEHTHSAQTAIQEVLIEDNPRHDSPVPPTDAKHPVNRGEKTPSQEQPSPARVPSVSIPVPTPVTAASESIPPVPQPQEAVQERDSVKHPRGPIPA